MPIQEDWLKRPPAPPKPPKRPTAKRPPAEPTAPLRRGGPPEGWLPPSLEPKPPKRGEGVRPTPPSRLPEAPSPKPPRLEFAGWLPEPPKPKPIHIPETLAEAPGPRADWEPQIKWDVVKEMIGDTFESMKASVESFLSRIHISEPTRPY